MCALSAKQKRSDLNDSYDKTDTIDRAILNVIQVEFPITKKPFEIIGRRVGISEKEAFDRIKKLTGEGYIRRIGPILDRKKLGYASLLCGTHVDENLIELLAEEINKETGVTHNYERDGELNLWFTVTMNTMHEIDKFITTLEKTFGIRIYKFPEKRTFKIKTYFPL